MAPKRDLDLEALTRPAHRDLGDERLWEISLLRSRDRREAVPAGRPGLSAATASIALVTGAIAIPAGIAAAPAAAGTGLVAVQKALGVTADGVMGPETRSALRRFQREHGLSADGHVGPLTRTALGVGRTAAGTTGTTAPASAPAAAPTARTGSVADVQRKLGVDADGVMGPVTRRAVSTFQSANGLPATGRLDRSTRTAILQGPDGTATTRTVSVSDDGSATPAPAAPSGPGTGASAAVESARAQLGKPYRSAGKGPDGFDCSGLTAYVFNAAGVSLGSSSYSQYGQGTSVQRSEIQPGDLVFFDSNGSGASHVGIATSPTTMISATSHGVKENSFTSGYWAAHYVGARRVA